MIERAAAHRASKLWGMCLALLQTYTRAWLADRALRQSSQPAAPVAASPSPSGAK
jgi:hypothetical protein